MCTSSLWYFFVELEKGQTLRPSNNGGIKENKKEK